MAVRGVEDNTTVCEGEYVKGMNEGGKTRKCVKETQRNMNDERMKR